MTINYFNRFFFVFFCIEHFILMKCEQIKLNIFKLKQQNMLVNMLGVDSSAVGDK